MNQELINQLGDELYQAMLSRETVAPLTSRFDLSIDDVAFSADGRRLWLQAEDRGMVPVFAMDAAGGVVSKIVANGITGTLVITSVITDENLGALLAKINSPRKG